MSILEEGKGPEDFFLVTDELLRGQAQIQRTGVEEGSTGALFAREVRREGSFGLACCLDGAAGAGEGGLTRGGDTGIGGGATARAGIGPVMS